jgi:hypothetical protein
MTYSWCRTEIEKHLAFLKETIFLVQLDQLERSSGAVPLLLGQLVPFVKPTLSMFLLHTHLGPFLVLCPSKPS